MKKLWRMLEGKMNDYSIRKKLAVFYVCCVLLPLFVTDSVILVMLYRTEMAEKSREMQNIADAVEMELTYSFKEAVKVINSFYLNRSVNEFLEQEYDAPLDFYTAATEISERNFYEVGTGVSGIVLCADNDTIVNGGHYYRLSSVKDEEWCRKLLDSNHDVAVQFYYVGEKNPAAAISRKISVVRRLNYYGEQKKEKIIRLDLDYSAMAIRLSGMQYNIPFYVCSGDRIIFSNAAGYSSTKKNFNCLTGKEKIGYCRDFDIYGEPITILVMKPESNVFGIIRQHLFLILLMLAVDICLPCVMAVIFNRSIVSRLELLNKAFDAVEAESLKEIEDVKGRDEIGNLMQNYNRMVERSRELIRTVYKDKMEKQKMDIARQNAELLALHSQIDPHFLFNVLEGIRMHSIIKGEEETAAMVEKLAVLERQNVDWKRDMIRVEEEITFVEAYLELQKYRFGERLSYRIKAEEECSDYMIPKLTLATFVENACIHGIGKKAVPCWIYVRVYQKEGWMYLEIEDTGAGMTEEKAEELRENMRINNIDELMNNERVGFTNACLRLTMASGGKAEFELESELNIGTFVVVKTPVDSLSTDEEGDYNEDQGNACR